jgi:hypothetical protein
LGRAVGNRISGIEVCFNRSTTKHEWMSNVGSASPPTARTPSGRTYWIRRNIAPSAGKEKRRSGKDPRGKRFVEPYRLSKEQRDHLVAHLAENAIGDAESRMLFTAALEYDLAGCRDLIDAAPEPAVSPPARNEPAGEMAQLATAIRALDAQLAGLDAATSRGLQRTLEESDRFKRTYDGHYLESLRLELARLAVAATALGEHPIEPTVREPALAEKARQFLLRAADAYRDCFEQQAIAEKGSAFILALTGIVTVTGVRIPTEPRIIAEALAQAGP